MLSERIGLSVANKAGWAACKKALLMVLNPLMFQISKAKAS